MDRPQEFPENRDYALVFKGLPLREAYFKNILWIALQYSPTGANTDEFIALALVNHKGDSRNTTACFRSRSVSDFEVVDVHSRSCGDQNNVLIGDVQVVQPFKAHLPANVGLYFVNNYFDNAIAWRKSISFMSIDGTYKRLPVPVKREPTTVTPSGVIGFGCDVVRVIEGGPKVVNGIAENGWDVLVERFGFG